MQIITKDDSDFPDLLNILQGAKMIGQYSREGRIHLVLACPRFLMITTEGSPEKIAIKPSRTMLEARNLALEYLSKEEYRGSEVSLLED